MFFAVFMGILVVPVRSASAIPVEVRCRCLRCGTLNNSMSGS